MQEIRKAVWDGQVAVCVRLAPGDVAALSPPPPVYALLSRHSYFPLALDRLRAHFAPFSPSTASPSAASPSSPTPVDDVWLSDTASAEPLRWHLPVGTLYDLAHALSPTPPPVWNIAIHFLNFPEDRVMRLTPDALKASFMSTLKEANFLKHGDGTKVMNLSRHDQDELWTAIGSGAAMERFYTVNDKLLGDPHDIRSVAVRLVRRNGPTVQLPVKPLRGDGMPATLGDALAVLGAGGDARVRVQGVCPPLDAPLFELQRSMSHPDNFLYCVLLA